MKLNTKKASDIKARLAAGATQRQVAKDYGISRSVVSDIATGRIWKSAPGTVPAKRAGGQSKPSAKYNPTDERILELGAEINHLRDERSVLQKQVKAMSKSHGLFKAITKEMGALVKPLTALPTVVSVKRGHVKDRQIEEHLVMHLSDGHHDQIVKPSDCGGLERYDFRISMRRAEQYVDTVLKWTQQTLNPQFYFPSLTVLAYGDHTSGEIHNHMQRSYFRNMFKNASAIGQLHALMYRDLAPYFETVNVVYVPGNHGRRSIKKDYHGAHDNWDYLVADTAAQHCSDIKNINFVIPDAWSINLDINGVGFSVFHGDDVRSQLGVPWYGMERRQNRITALTSLQGGNRIRYFCCGHFHRPATLSQFDGELLMNGPWVATDAYSYNAFGGYTEPTQLLHGVGQKYGVTWRLPVKLKTDDEHLGPQRYKIDLMREIGNA
ncbi:MAG: hypothetical protein WC315_00165 [Candidatus Omnitrophota bacterium]|jgi:hypothetical protein